MLFEIITYGAPTLLGAVLFVRGQIFKHEMERLERSSEARKLVVNISDAEKLVHELLAINEGWTQLPDVGSWTDVWQHVTGVEIKRPVLTPGSYSYPKHQAHVKDDQGEWKFVETRNLQPKFDAFKTRRKSLEQEALGRALARRVLAAPVLGGPGVSEESGANLLPSPEIRANTSGMYVYNQDGSAIRVVSNPY